VAWFLARVRSDRTVAVLLIAPSIVAVGIFDYGFIGWTGYVSLSRWSAGDGNRCAILGFEAGGWCRTGVP
jgi:ABC-type sugar transport system permease subunit